MRLLERRGNVTIDFAAPRVVWRKLPWAQEDGEEEREEERSAEKYAPGHFAVFSAALGEDHWEQECQRPLFYLHSQADTFIFSR